MKIHVGTSGYSYKEWKGSFYPEKLPAAKMLPYYAEHFDTVEINNTFYRMPKPAVLESWRNDVPPGFRFVLKASQRITHRKKLEDIDDDLAYLLKTSEVLGEKRGPILFQLPPWLKLSVDRLQSFLSLLPENPPAAFEPRHGSWETPEVHDLLGERNVSLCTVDSEDLPSPPAIVETADWGYLRLRRCDYTPADLKSWAKRILSAGWKEAWVFFKHEDEGVGPDFARAFLQALGEERG